MTIHAPKIDMHKERISDRFQEYALRTQSDLVDADTHWLSGWIAAMEQSPSRSHEPGCGDRRRRPSVPMPAAAPRQIHPQPRNASSAATVVESATEKLDSAPGSWSTFSVSTIEYPTSWPFS